MPLYSVEVRTAEHQLDVDPELAGRGGGDRRVVRLGAADRHHQVVPAAGDLREVVLQLADLVAAERQTGLVVALDQQPSEPGVPGQPRGVLDRRRQVRQPHPVDRIETGFNAL